MSLVIKGNEKYALVDAHFLLGPLLVTHFIVTSQERRKQQQPWGERVCLCFYRRDQSVLVGSWRERSQWRGRYCSLSGYVHCSSAPSNSGLRINQSAVLPPSSGLGVGVGYFLVDAFLDLSVYSATLSSVGSMLFHTSLFLLSVPCRFHFLCRNTVVDSS